MSARSGAVRRPAPRCARSRSPIASADDGEILANPIGTLPMIGGRLAKATFGPELVMTDGEALLVENILPVGVDEPEKVVGAAGIRTARCSTSCGRAAVTSSWARARSTRSATRTSRSSVRTQQPTTQLLGMRGAPGNTINDRTSYWIPNHSTRVFVPAVDVVSGVGYDRAAELGERGALPRSRARRDEPLRAATSRRPTTGCGCGRCIPA